jgi:hypothetical protein
VGTTITASVPQSKQEKKVRGGISLDFTTNTTHTFPEAALQTASNATVDFDRNFAFSAKGLPKCNPTKLLNTSTEAAVAACPGKRILGSGDATLCNAAGACGTAPGGATGIVTPFNGQASGGSLSLLLHTRTSAGNTTVLDGTLVTSPLGGQFGKRLNVNVPDTSSTGQELTIFHTNIKKIVAEIKKKLDKATGKLKKIKTYYLAAKCSGDKIWQFQAQFIHRAGGPTTQGTTEVPCRQKK